MLSQNFNLNKFGLLMTKIQFQILSGINQHCKVMSKRRGISIECKLDTACKINNKDREKIEEKQRGRVICFCCQKVVHNLVDYLYVDNTKCPTMATYKEVQIQGFGTPWQYLANFFTATQILVQS